MLERALGLGNTSRRHTERRHRTSRRDKRQRAARLCHREEPLRIVSDAAYQELER